MSTTPRTDAAIACNDGLVEADFARQLETELAASEKENTYIRGQLSSVKCAYGHKTADGICSLGYPGCACADDWFCAQDEMHKAMCERLGAIAAERDALESKHQTAISCLEAERRKNHEAQQRIAALKARLAALDSSAQDAKKPA